jgi:hypothetical protein
VLVVLVALLDQVLLVLLEIILCSPQLPLLVEDMGVHTMELPQALEVLAVAVLLTMVRLVLVTPHQQVHHKETLAVLVVL